MDWYLLDNQESIQKILNSISKQRFYSFEQRSKTCALVAAHSGLNNRCKISHDLSFLDIEFSGKFNNNSNDLQQKFADNKIEYLRQFKFNICIENINDQGYITEKIIDCLKAGCIPIYRGGYLERPESPDRQVFNHNRIIFWYADYPQPAINQIKRLLNDPAYAEEFLAQDIFSPQAAQYLLAMNLNLKSRLQSLGLNYN